MGDNIPRNGPLTFQGQPYVGGVDANAGSPLGHPQFETSISTNYRIKIAVGVLILILGVLILELLLWKRSKTPPKITRSKKRLRKQPSESSEESFYAISGFSPAR